MLHVHVGVLAGLRRLSRLHTRSTLTFCRCRSRSRLWYGCRHLNLGVVVCGQRGAAPQAQCAAKVVESQPMCGSQHKPTELLVLWPGAPPNVIALRPGANARKSWQLARPVASRQQADSEKHAGTLLQRVYWIQSRSSQLQHASTSVSSGVQPAQ